MLFNSHIFIFIFLPITLLGFHHIGKKGHDKSAIAWLVSASLFFYGWWNPAYLGLLLFSTIFNYSIGILLSSTSNSGLSKKAVLVTGIVVNLSLLGYFKYANFFIDNLNILGSTNIILREIILPLGISFFTFQQIAYLVDAYYKETKEYSFLHYCLFVTFFPQLIAGPIVHHKEMMPQFVKNTIYKIRSKNLAIGLTIFALGLFKKVIIADGISVYSTPIFDAAEAGIILTFFEAWGGAFAYAFQLYFDFSGYSDMAIGLAWMFGIYLPLNFNSPYKATNISDFWRRWHMTLTRFIRDYLWNPVSLTLTRYAINKKYGNFGVFILTVIVPIVFSFFWIGLWHGAGWNFIIFGLLHGFYIIVYKIWTRIKCNVQSIVLIRYKIISRIIGWFITFIAVVFSWVFFRAESIEGASNLLAGMVGVNGIALPLSYIEYLNYFFGFGDYLFSIGVQYKYLDFFSGIALFSALVLLLLIVIFMPNIQQLMSRYNPSFKTYHDKINYRWMDWRPTLFYSLLTSVVFIISVLGLTQNSEFIYYNF